MSQQQHQHQQPFSLPMNSIALTTVHSASQGVSLPKIGTLIPNRIFVGGINSNTTEDELRGFFSVFGPIKDVKVIYDKSGLSKGSYGFVTFEDQETAEAIIKNEAETLIFKDRKLNVGYAVRKQHILPKQELGSTLLLTHNTCPIANGLQLVHLCPHDHSFIAMNPASMYCPTTVLLSPTASSPDICTLLTDTMTARSQSVPVGKSGSGPFPVKGVICAHAIPANPAATFGCSPCLTSTDRPVQSTCWHSESSCLPEKPKTAPRGIDLNHDPNTSPTLLHNRCGEPNNEFRFSGLKPGHMIQQAASLIRSSMSTESAGSWMEDQARSVASEAMRSNIVPDGLPTSHINSTELLGHMLYVSGKEYRTCPQSLSQAERNTGADHRSRPISGNLVPTDCSGVTNHPMCAVNGRVTGMVDQPTTRLISGGSAISANRRTAQPGCLFNPSFVTDQLSFGSGITLTNDNAATRCPQSMETKYESLYNTNKGPWPGEVQPLPRREDSTSNKQNQFHGGQNRFVQSTMNPSHNCLEVMLRQSRWPGPTCSANAEYFNETLPSSVGSETNEQPSHGSLRQTVPTLNSLADMGTPRLTRLCTMDDVTATSVTGQASAVGCPDEHEQCVRRIILEKMLLERSESSDIPSNKSVPGEQHNLPACYRQTNRQINAMPYEGCNEPMVADSTPHLSYGINSLLSSQDLNGPDTLTNFLAHKDTLNNALPKRVYDDEIHHTTTNEHLVDAGSAVKSITTNGLSPKQHDKNENIISHETDSTSDCKPQSAEIRTLSAQKLGASAMNLSSIATTACGDISKQRLG